MNINIGRFTTLLASLAACSQSLHAAASDPYDGTQLSAMAVHDRRSFGEYIGSLVSRYPDILSQEMLMCRMLADTVAVRNDAAGNGAELERLASWAAERAYLDGRLEIPAPINDVSVTAAETHRCAYRAGQRLVFEARQNCRAMGYCDAQALEHDELQQPAKHRKLGISFCNLIVDRTSSIATVRDNLQLAQGTEAYYRNEVERKLVEGITLSTKKYQLLPTRVLETSRHYVRVEITPSHEPL
jgi:hypothetical protein